MCLLTVDNIEPKDINTKKNFQNLIFNELKTESIIYNIILMLQNNGNQWISFSFKEYTQKCVHRICTNEKLYFERLRYNGYLNYKDGRYSINNSLIQSLQAYVSE